MNDLTRLQRKLIPVNIVVAIISLVAAISIMFAPLLTINLGSLAEQVVQISESESDDSESNDVEITGYVKSLIGAVGEIKLSLTTYAMLDLAFSKDPVDHIAITVSDKIREVEDDVVANVAVEMIPQLIEDGLSDVNVDTENLDVPAILEKFDEVFKSESEEQTKEAISNLVDELQAQAVTTDGEQLITDDMKEEVKEVVQQILDDVIAELGDENLSLESFICVTISKFINGSGWTPSNGARAAAAASVKAVDEEPGENEESSESNGKIYTNYRDLINGIFGTSVEGENTGAVIDAEMMKMLKIALFGVKIFASLMAFFAAIWLIQFLFAAIHLCFKNKRFMMWYTKLWGFTPCFIFWVLPMIASIILPIFIPEAAAFIGILKAITSMTWICGVCYLLLWLVSIFWAFPIKHKIRKLLRQGATYD